MIKFKSIGNGYLDIAINEGNPLMRLTPDAGVTFKSSISNRELKELCRGLLDEICQIVNQEGMSNGDKLDT